MSLRYLKNPTGTASGGGTLTTELVYSLFSNYPKQILVSNTTASTSKVTGAVVISGGLGVGGSVYLTNLVASSNISGNNSTITNRLTVGSISSSSITNSGLITASSGNISQLVSTNFTANTAALGTMTATGATITSATITTGVITTLSGDTSSFDSTDATDATITNLQVDSIQPLSGSKYTLGSMSQIRITGGSNGQVLTTDGSGNLTWTAGAVTAGYGLQKVGTVLSLLSPGTTAGVYSQVTVDIYGRVLSGTTSADTLQSVTSRGSSSDALIVFSNETDSGDITQGAVVVTGGLGVGKTLTTTDLLVQDTTSLENGLTVQNGSEMYGTMVLHGQDQGTIPLRILSGSLNGAPTSGSIEFDGTNLYVTTTTGRQIILVRQAGTAATAVLMVRAVATTNINIANPTQTVLGVNVWDGVTLLAYNRVMLTGQSTASQNGLYIWTSSGVPLVRASDADSVTGIYSGTIILVGEGTLHGGSIWRVATTGTISVGSTSLSITQILSKDNISIARLDKDTSAGLIARTTYGNVVLRSVTTDSPFLSVTNGSGASGNIVISSSTVPVSGGGTGRDNFWGYLRGLGTSTTSSNTIPVASVTGLGSMSLQNSGAVTITGGNVTGLYSANIIHNVGVGGDLRVDGNVYSVGGSPLRNVKVTIDDTPPVAKEVGDVWYDATSGASFQYINDGTSSFWIQFGTSF